MTNLQIVAVAALAVLVCNLLAVVARRRYPEIADRLVRYAPLMFAAASAKDREAGIRRLIDEVLRLEAGEAISARMAAAELAATPKPPTADKPPAAPPAGPALVLCLAVLAAASQASCTPAARAEAKAIGVPVAAVAGGVCEQISGVMRDTEGGPFVEFACTIIRAAGSVIGNLSTSGGVAVDRPDGPPVRVVVRVYLEGGKTEVQP